MHVIWLAFVVGGFMLGPALIEPIPAILQMQGINFPRASLETAQFYSYPLHSLVSRDPDYMSDSIGQLVPLLTLLCVPLARQRRQRGLWLALGLGLLILALGPYWQDTHIPMPYWLVHKLLGEQYRTPVRFTTPATLALVTFIVLSLANWFERSIARRWQPWLVGAAIAGLVLDSGMLAPFPITFMSDYRIYHEIGRDSEEYALLEVPVSPASGFGELGGAPDLQYYSYIHHKQIINGIVSRVPSSVLDRYSRSPLLNGLTGGSYFPPLDVASRELADKLNRWDMRYVLVHRNRLEPERARGIIEFSNTQPVLCLVDEEGDLMAYQRIRAWADCPRPEMSALPAGTVRLELGELGHTRYVGPGWYDVENIGGPEGRWAGEIPTSTLRLLLPRQNIRVSFNALTYPPDQSVTAFVNGHSVAQFRLTGTWQVYQFDIPEDILPAAGPALIELRHAHLLSAAERGENPDQRPLAAAYTWFEFVPLAP
jgi:hypothetical protein